MIETMRLRKGITPGYLPEFRLIICRRFRTMEAASLRLQKEAKGYLDSLRGG